MFSTSTRLTPCLTPATKLPSARGRLGCIGARADIRHEQGIAHKHGTFHQISHIRRCMTGHMHGLQLQLAQHQALAIFHQMIKLAAVGQSLIQSGRSFWAMLHGSNMRANRYFATQVMTNMLGR